MIFDRSYACEAGVRQHSERSSVRDREKYMTHHEYRPSGVCSRLIEYDLEGDKVYNVKFTGGCNGNLKAIGILVDGMSVDELESKLSGNTCAARPTSCADQLAKAVRVGLEA